MDGDVAKIQRRAEEFRDLPEALQRNLQTFLTLIMDILASAHQKAKTSLMSEATRQAVSAPSCSCGGLRTVADGRCAEPCVAAQEVAVAHDLCGHAQVSAVARRVFVSGTAGRRDRSLKWVCSILVCGCTFFYVFTMSVRACDSTAPNPTVSPRLLIRWQRKLQTATSPREISACPMCLVIDRSW